MKQVFSLCMICFWAISAMAQCATVPVGYVDLGLPSGTLWKLHNEAKFYTYEEAITTFGNQLPEKHHFVELEKFCEWKWIDDGSYQVIGPNGNNMILPAAGYRGCGIEISHIVSNIGINGYYWSSTPYDSDNAWNLCFDSIGVYIYQDRKCGGVSVRLVQ